MPTSVASLAIFIVLLAPGLVYLAAREGRYPAVKRTALRESGTVALISLVADVVVLIVFGTVRGLLPERTPDVGALIREPEQFVEAYYLSASLWALGMLLVACIGAGVVGRLHPVLASEKAMRSAWVLAFDDPRRREGVGIWVECQLLSGGYVAGYLRRFSTTPDDDDGRDLTIEGPVRFRAAGSDTVVERNVNLMIVPASSVEALTVSFVEAAATSE